MEDYEDYRLQYVFLARGRKEQADTKRDCINKAWAVEGPTTIKDVEKCQVGRE